MILQKEVVHNISNGLTNGAVQFTIDSKDSAHIISILRDKLYTDKIGAVVREYIANAKDANVEAGRGDVPIKVQCPSILNDYTFSVRDYGNGLTYEQVIDIFRKYGSSTKRSSNLSIGQLGIGAKSAFAYVDSFLIHSYVGGMKHTYINYNDESGNGALNLVGSVTTTEPTGLEIVVSARSADVPIFQQRCITYTQFINPIPECIGFKHTPLDPVYSSQNFSFINVDWRNNSPNITILMGGIPYPINIFSFYQKASANNPFKGLANNQNNWAWKGFLEMPLGSVTVSASRETLELTTSNANAIFEVLENEIKLYISAFEAKLKEIEDAWDKRIYIWKYLSANHAILRTLYGTSNQTNISFENVAYTISPTFKFHNKASLLFPKGNTEVCFLDYERHRDRISIHKHFNQSFIHDPNKPFILIHTSQKYYSYAIKTYIAENNLQAYNLILIKYAADKKDSAVDMILKSIEECCYQGIKVIDLDTFEFKIKRNSKSPARIAENINFRGIAYNTSGTKDYTFTVTQFEDLEEEFFWLPVRSNPKESSFLDETFIANIWKYLKEINDLSDKKLPLFFLKKDYVEEFIETKPNAINFYEFVQDLIENPTEKLKNQMLSSIIINRESSIRFPKESYSQIKDYFGNKDLSGQPLVSCAFFAFNRLTEIIFNLNDQSKATEPYFSNYLLTKISLNPENYPQFEFIHEINRLLISLSFLVYDRCKVMGTLNSYVAYPQPYKIINEETIVPHIFEVRRYFHYILSQTSNFFTQLSYMEKFNAE